MPLKQDKILLGWKETTLGEVVDFVVDNRGKTPPITNTGYELLEVNAITDTFREPDYSRVSKFVDEDTFQCWFRTGTIKSGDVLIPTVGTIGNISFSKSNRGAIAQNLIALRTNEYNDSLFLYYFFKNSETKSKLLKLDIGGVQPSIKVPHLLEMTGLFPPLPEQKAIAAILSSFDDKIELLRRQNKTLENIAKTIFKEWFVNFTVNGKKLKVNSKTGLPEEWRMGKLGDVAHNVKNGVSANSLQDHEHYVGLEHMERKHLAIYNWGRADEVESNKALFARGDILFGKLRAYFHKVCFAPIAGICSTDILVIRPVNPTYFSFCLLWFFSEDVVKYSDASSSGTRMPRTSWDILSGYKIPIPDDSVVIEFNQITKPMIDKVERNIFSIQTLSKLRNALLPKLMKGEIRVKDTKFFIKEKVK